MTTTDIDTIHDDHGGDLVVGVTDRGAVSLFLGDGATGIAGEFTPEQAERIVRAISTAVGELRRLSVPEELAAAAERVREAREALRVCPPERGRRVEREATLEHYVGALLDLLPAGG